jgi:hypothetical protein
MSDIEFSKEPEVPQRPQGITFETKKRELSPSEEDESLNLEMIRRWEANHPKAKAEPIESKDNQIPKK